MIDLIVKPSNIGEKKIQYYAALAITGGIRGTSRVRIYNELDPEALADIRLYRKMTSFYKIVVIKLKTN